MDFKSFIPKYLESIKTSKTTESTIKNYTKYLYIAVNIFLNLGIKKDTDDFYSQLKNHLSDSFKPSTIEKNILPLTRKFFTWCFAQSEGVSQMQTQYFKEAQQTATDTDHAQNEATAGQKQGRGRPRKNEEPREKISVYLSQSNITALKDLAGLFALNVSDYVQHLITREIQQRAADIETVREIRNR